ncbi:c-type cytochrome [Dyadobacter crusticola]|uniref:c-type cytochrome n=1 Tax=Dyadobacter crusticola TaxID=292407 RepID=UPI001E3DA398|nr:cytochrome c [Dyadobacter crusticola]
MRISSMIRIAFLFCCIAFISCKNEEELKTEQYFVEGMQLYTTHCSNCHQNTGEGLSNLYPPIKGSDLLKDKAFVSCVIRNGMEGTILVNGKEFNRPMPGNPKLTDIEIAEIVTFVSVKWGKDSVYTPITFVEQALANCKTR